MIVADRADELPRADRAVAIGTFDGVHRGHKAVIEAARSTGLRSTVVTFHPHPREVLGYSVQVLTTLERRLELLEEAAPDDVLVVEFTSELSRDTPEEFVHEVIDALGTRIVVAGESFRFGRGRSGDTALLRRLGFEVREVPIVEGVSSSRIRELLAEGAIGEAAAHLGRPHELEGLVVAGDQRGGTLGFPTANLAVPPNLLVPAHGIYAGAAVIDGATAPDRALDRRQPPLRGHRAPHRGVPARFRRRSLRRAPATGAVAAPTRRAVVRERGGARRSDRPRRGADPPGRPAGIR